MIWQNSLNFRNQLNINLIFCWVFACIALILSFLYEYIWNIIPCTLCKIQRVPFIFILLFLPFSLAKFSKNITIKIIALNFLISTLIAGFHFLIQMHIISDSCAIPNINTLEDFEKILSNINSCSKISWSLLGLPISFFNTVISMFFCISLVFRK